MQRSEKVLQGAYAISIAWLSSSIIINITKLIPLPSMYLFLFLATIGATLLALGLFKFKKGLGAGLALAGLASTLRGALPYTRNLSDSQLFALALGMLLIVGYALYRLQRQNQGK